MPESFFVLSKENLEIAIDEITAIAKMYDRFSKIKIISNLVIIQSKTNWYDISNRASFVKVSGQILRKMSGLFLDENNYEILKNTKTFVCRIINLSSNQFNIPENNPDIFLNICPDIFTNDARFDISLQFVFD